MNSGQSNDVALIYPVRQLDNWWKYVGQQLNYSQSFTVGDLRGDGDFNVVDDFYHFQRQYYRQNAAPSELVTSEEIEDVIARCRLLRFLPYRLARSMVLGMAEAMKIVLDQVKPTVIISFPIDRYVSDVLRLVGSKRAIPHHEFTVGPMPETVMVLNRGKLNVVDKPVDAEQLKKNIADITDKYFEPSYIQNRSKFTKTNFWKKFLYFKVRGFVFKGISMLRRDPLNLHYLDAQSFLGHKPTFSDARVLDMVDYDWRKKLDTAQEGKKVFLGLAVFPEGAIDYWIDDLKIIEYEDLMVHIAQELSANGFSVFVKDHPLQFGFRQAELIERLLSIPNTVLVPYEIDGKQVISETDVTVTTTGTIGLEASLIGKKAVIVENYYSTPEDFIFIDSYDVKGLAQKVIDFEAVDSLQQRQERIISRLMRGSFDGEYYAYQGYEQGSQCEQTQFLCQHAKVHLEKIMKTS